MMTREIARYAIVENGSLYRRDLSHRSAVSIAKATLNLIGRPAGFVVLVDPGAGALDSSCQDVTDEVFVEAQAALDAEASEEPDDAEEDCSDAIGHLVVTRRVRESVSIGDDIAVEIVRIRRGEAKLLIRAPRGVRVCRPDAAMTESR